MNHHDSAIKTISIELAALEALREQLDDQFNHVVDAIKNATGKVVISGIGKSGLIGQKVAATLASTGTPSFFLHPGEASHGDLGMISPEDVVVLISYSGETEECLRMLAFLQDNDNITISMTGEPGSTLAKNTHYHLNVHVPEEACPLQLAPTASTTATLVLGDALAMALMEARGFEAEDFARFHPGGSLGRKLLTKVGDVMRTDNLPFVPTDISPSDLLMRMSEGKLGLAIFGTPEDVKGILTDGDLRRGIVKYGSLDQMDIDAMMTQNPICVPVDMKVVKAEELMRERKITVVLVEGDGVVKGVYQIFN